VNIATFPREGQSKGNETAKKRNETGHLRNKTRVKIRYGPSAGERKPGLEGKSNGKTARPGSN
jgi:hypothetical protein